MTQAPGNRKNPAGFALIVTISLMVLLVILAVGLLSLSVITLRSAGQSDAMQVARANARLALTIAIGELQKSAGPDQRITATADIAAGTGGQRVVSGQPPQNNIALDGKSKGLTSLNAGARHWTGVFVNQDTPTSIYRKTPSAKVQMWMVSGNENSRFGQPLVTPATQSIAVGGGGGVADPDVATVLVGSSSVGEGNVEDYVAAPLVEIRSQEESGFSGGFSYWVGDEGVKSRIDMERENDNPESYGSLVAQRRGWETIEGFEEYPPAFEDADAVVTKLVSMPTSELLIPTVGEGSPSPLQSVFHAATPVSAGVICNPLEGGLRVDLSAALAGDLPKQAPVGAYDNFPVKDGRVIPGTAFSGLQYLTWDDLKEFHDFHDQLSSGGELRVRERTGPDTAPVTPVIADFRILMGVSMTPASSDPNSNSFKVNPCGKFAVTIANPYPYPLVWENDLEFEIKNQTPSGNAPARIWQFGGNCVYITRYGDDEPAVFNRSVFTIGKGRLEPGEARAFTNSSKIVRPKASATARTVVPMGPFVGSRPFDFNYCVEVDTGFQTNLPVTIDVRESRNTTLILLEMKLAGSSQSNTWLQRIEGFELDNGYFSPNNRSFDPNVTRNLQGPVPLMLYSYQASQPGADYISLMPAGYQMGQRASTIRTFADFNLRAGFIHRSITSYNPPPYFMESNNSRNQLPFEPGGQTGPGFTRNLVATPVRWGYSGVSGGDKVMLFTVPKEFISLAQLQHADLTNDDVSRSVGHQPGNAFGNSYATPFVKRQSVNESRTDYRIIGYTNLEQYNRNYYDISHILNSSMWDRYFFSSTADGSTVPENPTMLVSPEATAEDLLDPAAATGHLMVKGAFNINSTDKRAWKAYLASSRYFKHSADESESVEAAFPRSLEQITEHELPPTGSGNDSYSGYRRLNDQELDALATEIVRQVRRRGPFVSLSHFVNRALAGINQDPELSRSGALQLALDESGVNISIDGKKNGFKRLNPDIERVTLAQFEGAPRADLDGGDRASRPASVDPSVPDWATTSTDNNFGAVASIIADREMLKNGTSTPTGLEREQGYRSTGIPAWVTQADVLQIIGPSISARSDTFLIRASGQARNASGNVTATAYCEAVVQRQPSYVDPANKAHDRGDSLTATNKIHGRKFEIVSFRWLSSLEI